MYIVTVCQSTVVCVTVNSLLPSFVQAGWQVPGAQPQVPFIIGPVPDLARGSQYSRLMLCVRRLLQVL